MKNKIDDRIFIYQIDSEDKITFVNKEWIEFAKENDAERLASNVIMGSKIWDFIEDYEVQHLYQIVFNKVRNGKNIRKLPFRCDSPECRRYMEMTIIKLDENIIQIQNNIVKLEFRNPVPILSGLQDRSQEIITICSTCKNVKIEEDKWCEVEEAMKLLDLQNVFPLPQFSHGICTSCYTEWLKNIEE